MALVDSLLAAIVRADGDALVMHVGDKPYVVTARGTTELSAQPLKLDAVSGMLGQLLPGDLMRQLEEFGAIEHELPPNEVARGERFTVVAARGGDDVWIEVRRHRAPLAAPAASVPPPAPTAPPQATPASSSSAPPAPV
ncbi:MAG: hypothetical protein AB1635_12195, partial [Acidobacteriota bacterium]